MEIVRSRTKDPRLSPRITESREDAALLVHCLQLGEGDDIRGRPSVHPVRSTVQDRLGLRAVTPANTPVATWAVVQTLTLNQPPANPYSYELMRELDDAILKARFDVAVDVRRGSPTFGRSVAITLTADSFLQVYIPPGFAHGFYALSETVDLIYKVLGLSCSLGELNLQSQVKFEQHEIWN